MFTKNFSSLISKGLPIICLSASLNLVMAGSVLGNQAIIDSHFQNPQGSRPASQPTQPDAFILLSQGDPAQLAQIQDLIKLNGGRTTHTLPHQALIAQVPSELLTSLAKLPGVAGVYTQAVDLASLDVYGPSVRGFGSAWNNLITPQNATTLEMSSEKSHEQASHDAFVAPDLPAFGAASNSTGQSVKPGYYQTSEYMTGSVAVGLVLIESNGQIDSSTENWTQDEKQLVFSEIMAALNWWSKLEPRANLSFVYDDHFSNPLPSSYEPITRPMLHQQLWISDAMSALGYQAASYFTRVRDYNNALRTTYQTDWAFTIFVVDSSADSDNRFSDSYFAYAYLGGPFMVMTYGNNGYGPHNMDAVAAHEIGHIFHALDQYASAAQPCTRRSGYLDVENLNSQAGGCSSNVNSIMRGQIYPYTAKAIDPYAAGQIGWRDSDGDNILDPLDVHLDVSLDDVTKSEQNVTATGLAKLSPYASPRRTSATINKLNQVKYRLNYGAWQLATAEDNHFDEASERFNFTSPTLASGLHVLEVAAFDTAGNVSADYATETILIPDPLDPGPNTELYTFNNSVNSQSVTINGIAYHFKGSPIAQVWYRVNNGSWQSAQAQDGAFNQDIEAFVISLNLSEPGTYMIETYATDTQGNHEVIFASREVQFGPPPSTHVFLPFVMGSS